MVFNLNDLAQTLNAGAGAVNQYRQQRLLGDLGDKLKSGDFEGAAQTALGAGDVGTGLELLKLGETRKQKDAQRASDAQAMELAGLGSSAPPSAGGFGVADSLWKAQIGQESGGQQFGNNGQPLTSSKGAVGVAQVMPGTAPEAARLAGLPLDIGRYHNDAGYNEALGRAYMGQQLKDFGDPLKALAAYNAGPGRVREAIAKGGDNWLSLLPAETRNYVATVGRGQNVQVADASGGLPQSAGGSVQYDNTRLTNLTKALAIAKSDSQKDAIKELIKTERQKQSDNPSLIREYEYAKSQGYNGSFQDFRVSTKPQTTINTGGGPSKSVYDTVEKRTEDARAAAQSLPAFQEAKRLLDSGNITLGAGADLRVGMQKIGALFGLDPTAASNAETFRATVAPTVLALVKGLGAGAGISNADRDFAEKAAGGNINLEPGTIRRILQIGQRAAQAKIDAHNKMVDSVYPESVDTAGVRSLFKVDVPAYDPQQTSPKAQQGQLKPAPSELINEAQSALKAGRDRGAIIEKMRSLGYDPSGL